MRRLVVVLALGVLCGCGQPVAEQTTAGGVPADDPSRLDRQATEVLARWAESVAKHGDRPRFVPIGSGFGLVGDAEPEVADNFKAATMTGKLEAAPGVLPAGDPGTGEVRWADGQVMTLPLMSAEAALQAMKQAASGDCHGCTPLQVTGARLVTVTTDTDRGQATAPAWEYELAGTAARIAQVAVAPSAGINVTPPPWDPFNPPAGLRLDSATVAADGRTVTAHFTGAREGTGPCTSDYTARAVESEHAAVVIIEERRHGGAEACAALGYPRTATVTLAAPLGQRTLLQVTDGTPITSTP
jgi:hypothetical protein